MSCSLHTMLTCCVWTGCALFAATGVRPACGEAPEASESPTLPVLPRQLVVVRLTEDWFTSRIDKDFDEQSPVDLVILGTRVRGTARTIARPTVQLHKAHDKAALQVVFSGSTTSRTIGRNGPAIINSRSQTRFTATKQIVFAPGKGFQALPAQIEADTRTTTESVGSTRGGWIGRLVQRRAWKKIEENRPLTTAIARANAKQRIGAAFDRHIEDLLVRLNRAADLRETLAMLRGQDGAPRYTCCSTDRYVEIMAAAGGGDAPPRSPPALSDFNSPVQVWVHKSLIPSDLAPTLVRLQSAQSSIQNLIDRFSRVFPVSFGPPAQRQSAGRSPAMQYQFVDDWTVLSWNDSRPPISIASRR